jgi:hypothetical protein
MTRPENPQPAQISHTLERSRRTPTNGITTYRRILKRTLPTISDSIRSCEPAKPIADPVCVTGPDEGRNA